MKTIYEGELRFITPAFLSGADQAVAEIRVPSIRGALRWWFRAVGGTRDDEIAVFGGVHGGAVKSAVVIRVTDEKLVRGQDVTAPQNTAKGYLYYFATVSGKTKGIRSAAGHYAEVGSSFRLVVSLRSPLEAIHEKLLNNALGMFLRYGALGLRATRGCGAFTATEPPAVDDDVIGKFIIGRISDESFTSGVKCQLALGTFLQDLRRDNHLSAKRESALGYSMGSGIRFSSALKLRPKEVAEGKFEPYVIYSDAASREKSLTELIEGRIV